MDEPGLDARLRSNRATWATRRADVPYADLRQFFSQPGKVEKGTKPAPIRRKMHPRVHPRLLECHEAKRAKPWTQKGKRFICGFTQGLPITLPRRGMRG